MSFTSRIAALALGAVMSLSALVGIAQAQSVPGLMFPPYNANGQQQCYVARPVQNVACGDLDGQLSNATRGLTIAGRHVQAYVVFVREPDGGVPAVAGTPPGGVIADAIANTYRTKGVNAGFPANDFILLVMTQRADGSWFMAERWGADVTPYFSFPMMKNILDANVATLRAGNYHDYVAAVINQTVTAVGTAVNSANRPTPQQTFQPRPQQPQVIQHHEPSAPFPWGTVLGWLIGIVVVGGGIILVIKVVGGRSAAKDAYTRATAQTKPVTDNIGTQIDTLTNSYGGLAQGTKKYTPESKDETVYKAALIVAGNYFSHAEALKAYQAQIDAAVAKGDYAKANALVAGSIEITGDEIAPELRTATSGRIKEESIPYKQLVSTIGAEFDSANRTFAELDKALQKTMTNKTAIDAALAAVEAAKTALPAAGISFAPFQDEYDAIKTGSAAFVKKVFGAPITAFDESEALKTRVTALSTALATVMELKKTQVAVATKVEEARAKVNGARAKACQFTFASGTAGTFALTGVGIDEALADADAQVKALGVALEGGKVDAAATAKDAALAAAQKAADAVDTVFKAKASVEADAPALEAQLGHDNAAIASIRTLYAAQDFVTASTAVESLKELGKLITTRDNTKRAVGQAANWASDNTRGLLASASRSVDTVSALTTGANVNWAAVATAANAADAEFVKVNAALVADGHVLQGFKDETAALRHDFDAAEVDAGNADADQGPNGPKGQLGPVASKLATFEGLTSASTKQNWADLTAQVKSTRGTVKTAHDAATAQIAEAAEYDAKIREVENRYGSMAAANYSIRIPRTRKTYQSSASLSSAPQYSAYQAHLEAAETYRRQRQWDRMEAELAASQAQMNMMNTWMWYMVWTDMAMSNDRWAQQYAYDQGFQNGMSYDSYYTHVESQPGYDPSSGYEPTPVSEWTPSSPPASNCASSSGRSSCSSSSSSSSCSSSSSSSSCSSSSSSSSCSSSSSSSSCSSGSSSSCGSSS